MLIDASLHTLKHFHHLKLLILSTRIRSSKTTVSYGKRIWVTNSEVLEKSSQSFSKQEKGKLWCMQSGKTKLGKELSISSGSGTEKTELQQWQLLLGEKKKSKNYPPQKTWPSSLKSESFENVLISIEVHTEMCLSGKISYWSEEAAQIIRKKATIFGDQWELGNDL